MAWMKLPIQDQWQNSLDENAAGYVFKTYQVGTTTPIPMAIDSSGATTVSTATLNADGIPEVSGNEVTLYIDQDFRFAIYENASDAASDTNAFYGPVDIYNFESSATNVPGYAELRALSSSTFSDGQVVFVTDSKVGGRFIIRTGGVTDNGGTLIVFSDDSNRYAERDFANDIYIDWFGAVGDGAANDTVPMTNAFSVAQSKNGGTVKGTPNAVYATTALPAMTDNVVFDMAGSRMNATLPGGNTYGLRIGAVNSGVENGTIYVTSTGSPSSQLIFHACISIGEGNGLGGTVANPGYYTDVSNWYIRNMTLHTDRPYAPVIQGMGNCRDGFIENIQIPDSDYCTGIQFDWSDIGTGLSVSNLPGSRTAYDAGEVYTTHPHNIVITNITCGKLTVNPSGDLGSHIVRTSACYNIYCENLFAERTSLETVLAVGGNIGFELAKAEERTHRDKNIIFKNVACDFAENKAGFLYPYAIDIDRAVNNLTYLTLKISSVSGSFSVSETVTGGTSGATATIDNIYTNYLKCTSISGTFTIGETITGGTSGATAVVDNNAYDNIGPVIEKCNMVIDGITAEGANDASASDGVRIQDCWGAQVKNAILTGFKNGIAIDVSTLSGTSATTENITIDGGRLYRNRENGIDIRDDVRIKDVLIKDVSSELNNVISGQYAGIYVRGGTRIKMQNNILGANGEDTQRFGIIVSSSATRITAIDNTCLEVSGTDNAFNWASNSTSYGVMWKVSGNQYLGSNTTTPIGGADIIPFERNIIPTNNTTVGQFYADQSVLTGSTTPTTGNWIQGDIIYFTDPGAGGDIGSVCVTSGSPGTWKRFGQIDP